MGGAAGEAGAVPILRCREGEGYESPHGHPGWGLRCRTSHSSKGRLGLHLRRGSGAEEGRPVACKTAGVSADISHLGAGGLSCPLPDLSAGQGRMCWSQKLGEV